MANQKPGVTPWSWDSDSTPTVEVSGDTVATMQLITDAFSTALKVESPSLTRHEQPSPESPPSDHSDAISPCRH